MRYVWTSAVSVSATGVSAMCWFEIALPNLLELTLNGFPTG